MASRLQKFVDSIVFAGMNPGKQRSDSRRMRLLGPLRGPVERFLNGGRHRDPLYLSSRSFGQKLLDWAKVAVPLGLVAGGVLYGFMKYHHDEKPPEVLSPAEVAAKMLPALSQPIHIEENTDLEVVEVLVKHESGDKISGKVRNATDHEIQYGDVDFTLTGNTGTQLGSARVKVANLAPGQVVPFEQAIPEKDATFAIVRDVHTR